MPRAAIHRFRSKRPVLDDRCEFWQIPLAQWRVLGGNDEAGVMDRMHSVETALTLSPRHSPRRPNIQRRLTRSLP